MQSQFDEISFLGMSNSDQLFLAEKDLNKAIEFEFLLRRPTLEFPDGYRIVASQGRDQLHRLEEDVEDKEEKKIENTIVSSDEPKMRSLGEFEADEDDDGYRTPTSLEQKIPVIRECPPAPRKPKSLPLTKRKASSNIRQLQVDLSKEIESLFSPALLADLSRKIKKVRADDTK